MHVQLHCKANSSMVKPVTSSTNYIHSSNYTAYTLPPPTQRFTLHSTDTSPTNPTVRWQLHQQSIPVNCAVRDKGDVPTLAKARGSAFAGTAAQAEEKNPTCLVTETERTAPYTSWQLCQQHFHQARFMCPARRMRARVLELLLTFLPVLLGSSSF